MKFGITYNTNKKTYESGANVCALHLYKLLSQIGYDVELITLSSGNIDDISGYRFRYINDITIENCKNRVDCLIDIDGVLRPNVRKRISDRSFVFLRGFLQFSELDMSVYPQQDSIPRSFEGVSEVWCWDILNPLETLDCLQDLFGCPIRRVPFIWDSCHLTPLSLQNRANGITRNIRIMEKNKDNTSSPILMISALPELKKVIQKRCEERDEEENIEYIVHCSNEMWENKFFKENVLKNVEHEKIPLKRCDRMSYNNLSGESDFVLSHVRFCGLRAGLLDLVWLGIPFVHNSPILADLSEEFRVGFYPDNRTTLMINAVERVLNLGDKWINIHESMKKELGRWSIIENANKWKECIPTTPIISPVISPIISHTVTPNNTTKDDIIIGFSDMWPGFNYNNNFLTDSLRNNIQTSGKNIIGVDYWNIVDKSKINVVIFSPLGQKWKMIPKNVSKVFFSAENWGISGEDDESVKLFITPYRNKTGNKHVYIPTWMTFLNWFSDSINLPSGVECEDNPIRFPIHFATRVHPVGLKERKEFCGFVVSNPVCEMRNNTFKTVNEYKRVNSGGALFNNIGGQLSLKYPGGGCGDISKYRFLEQHKFQLCFENSKAEGYVTEKLLHSKIAGCIPIYWGDANAGINGVEFSSNGFLNVSDCISEYEVLKKIQELEANQELCEKMTSTPFLNSQQVQNGFQAIYNMSSAILNVIGLNNNSVNNDSVNNILTKQKVYVVNMDKRVDRWAKWLQKNYKYFPNSVERFSAVDGRKIEMNKSIYKLFQYNQFGWRKSVMGCALSHILLWYNLMNESDENTRYFICEDDMCFATDSAYLTLQEQLLLIPSDAELLYVGGVLPSNKQALSVVIKNVNSHWAKIQPNKLFTSSNDTETFHFCTYSYILTKSGAKKLIQWLENSLEKCHSGIDHILGHFAIGLNKYVSTPLTIQCFQEEEQGYIHANFNNVDSINTFDSDTRNITDSFSLNDLTPYASSNVNSNTYNSNIKDIVDTYHVQNKFPNNTIIYYLKEYKGRDNLFRLYEKKWIRELLGDFELKEFHTTDNFVNESWIIVMRPHSNTIHEICLELDRIGKQFKILHLSDEFSNDNIEFYKLDSCKYVLRNYLRSDIRQLSCLNKIQIIPLGYHHSATNMLSKDKNFTERATTWSFCGTKWFGRGDFLEKMKEIESHRLHLTDEWNSPNMIQEKEYVEILKNTKFCPILRGNNWETFRLYECLEHGVIPLVIRDEEGKDAEFWEWIHGKLSFIEIRGVEKAIGAIHYFLKNPDMAEKYREGLMKKWIEWKSEIKELIQHSN